MTTAYLDIRENSITVIIRKGNEIYYKRHLPLSGLSDLQETIKQLLKDSDLRPNFAHMIIPSSQVIVENITLLDMPLNDAEMIIKRRMLNKGIKHPLLHLTLLSLEGSQQTYMVEAIEKKTAERYIKPLSSQGIKVKTITTPFQINLQILNNIGKGAEPLGILNTGEEVMEFTIIADSFPVMYKRISLQKKDKDTVAEGSKEKLDKITLFKIAENFHNILRESKNILSGQSLSKVFLCGPLCCHKELVEILNELVEVKVLGDTDNLEDSCLYTTLKGLIKGVLDKKIANFLKSTPILDFIKRHKRFVFATTFVYLILLSSGFIYVENKHKKINLKLTQTMAIDKKPSKGISPFEQIRLLKGKDIPIYEVMRYIANNLPDGIFLEKISYLGKDDRTTLDLVFIFKDGKGIGRDALLTRLFKMLDNSIYLKKYGEPTFSNIIKEKKETIKVSLTVEVN